MLIVAFCEEIREMLLVNIEEIKRRNQDEPIPIDMGWELVMLRQVDAVAAAGGTDAYLAEVQKLEDIAESMPDITERIW
jgi:hypothetical protein